MGGYGSGGWNAKHRGTVEGHRRIDAVYFQRHKLIEEGVHATVRWGEGNSIIVEGGADFVRLKYRARSNGGDWTPVDERVSVEWRPRPFGGRGQAFFLCPRCGRRARYLSGAGVRFLCVKCHDLVNASSRERPGDRATRKMRKLRRQIGSEEGWNDLIGPKPKGMHQKTYEKIYFRIIEAEQDINDDMLRLLRRFQKIDESRTPAGARFWT